MGMTGTKNVIALLLVQFGVAVTSLDVVCYYTNWAQYRPMGLKYTVANIDPHRCTHIIFAFAKLSGSSYTNISPYETNDPQQWKALQDLKRVNPKLKTLLAIGGYTHGSPPFSFMARNQGTRGQFITNLISLLRREGFDGVDLDWEYPGDNNVVEDRQNLALLLTEIRQRFNMEAQSSSRSNLILTMAVAAGIEKAQKAYDVQVMQRTLDFFNVMTYDYHGSWENFTGLASPLNSTDDLSVVKTINWYLCQGASRDKIRLGLALYGRTWTLKTRGDQAVGSPAIMAGGKGKYTKTGGFLSMYEICEDLPRYSQTNLHPLGQVYYGTNGNQFITFENMETFLIKLKYLQEQGLGGVMMWSLDLDDFKQENCGLSFVRSISEEVLKMPQASLSSSPSMDCRTGPPPFTSRPFTTRIRPATDSGTRSTEGPRTTRKPITAGPTRAPVPHGKYYKGRPSCISYNGLLADPSSCRHYYVCLRSIGLRHVCRFGSGFNPGTLQCEKNYRCY